MAGCSQQRWRPLGPQVAASLRRAYHYSHRPLAWRLVFLFSELRNDGYLCPLAQS